MKLLTAFLAASLTLAATAQTKNVFGDYAKAHKATVSILAVSTSTHQSWAGNQDVYLADISIKDGDHQLAKVVDQYEGYGYPIRPAVLRDRELLKMQIVRVTECDTLGSKIFLPADARVFDASTRDTLRSHAGDMIPCYRTLHKTIKIIKGKK
jgi:hypothetical protein